MFVMCKKVTFLILFFPVFLFSQITTNSAGTGLTESTPIDVNKQDWAIPSSDVCETTDDTFAKLVFTVGAISESEVLESSSFTLSDFPDIHPVSNAKLSLAVMNFGAVALLTEYTINIYRTEDAITTTIFSKTGSTTISALDLLDLSFDDQSDWDYTGLNGANLDASSFNVEIVFSYTGGAIVDTGIDEIALEFTTDASLLPIVWNSFSGFQENNVIRLDWSTKSEINASHFDVEHSVDGKVWTVYEQIKAIGNSTLVQYYSFLDKFPISGVNYYRIKEVDFDNTINYSKIITVNYNSENKANSFWVVASNSGCFTIYSDGLSSGDFDITLINVNGWVMQKWPRKTIDNDGTLLNVFNLRAGIFYLSLFDRHTGKVEVVSFVY
jgi:hypothetical protein